MKRSAVLMTSLFVATFGSAAELSTMRPGNQKVEAPRPRLALDCTNVVSELDSLQETQDQNHDEAAQFAGDASFIMADWYRTLAPAEGRTVNVPVNYFDPMRQASNISAEQSRAFRDRADTIRADYNDIMEVLEGCIEAQ
jgi:hypothetical protein